jgi:N-acetylmuramoyl-L-alanine amidase/FG-GAP-like repeat
MQMMSRKHRDTSSEPERVSTAGLLAKGGRIIAMASVLAVAPMVTGFPLVSSPAQAHPVKSQLRHLGFVKSSVASMRAASDATGSVSSTPAAADPITTARAGAVTPVQDVAGAVTVVGVTWPKGAVSARDRYQIRTLSGATWSQWQSLVSAEGGPDPAEAATATAGTDPYVVTGASKYQVRSLTTDATVPTTATVQVVDPGASSADNVQPAPGAAAAATVMPTIYTRAAWGANESLRRAAPSYGKILVGFVHHTDSANSYTASEVPAMIRGMYAYHVQTLGWSDIGYNFLVDRFGRIWEGRYGGMTKAVVGAQTLNYNSVSMGVSAIGNYDVAAAPQAMTNAFKRIFAWKFSLAGIPAIGAVLANGKSLQRVSGHRDANATACPGRYLYAKLAEIRTGTAAIIAGSPPVVTPPVVTPPVIRSVINRDVYRNGAADLLSYSPGANGAPITGSTSLLAGAPPVPASSAVTIGTGWNSLRNVTLSPDLNGDGTADIIAEDPATGRLRIYLGNGRGGFLGVLYRGSGWNVMNRIIAAGDRNADGHNDILATTTNGALIYYPTNGAGGLYKARVVGNGWNGFSSLTNAGDLNGDRIPDLLATRTSDGALMMYAGAPGGLVRAGVVWGRGWGSLSPVVGGSDLDGDGYRDVLARLGDGLRTYSSDASGRFVRSTPWGAGWASFTQLSTGADWNGDGAADLLAVNPSAGLGALSLFAGAGRRNFTTRVAAFSTVPGADLVRIVGDVNGDGYTDAVARVRTNNTLVFLGGRSGGGFTAPVTIGSGWNPFTLVEAAGDYDGDGVPDLLARDARGTLFVYPLRRNLTFKTPKTIGVGFQGMQSVVGTGAFDKDPHGDVIALRASDHALILFHGTGSSALQGGPVLARAQSDLTQILGVGDYNGDGTADLVARSRVGSLWLYPGNGLGAVSGRQLVRGGEGVGHVVG